MADRQADPGRLSWEDDVLVDAAAELRRAGHAAAVDAVLSFSRIQVALGDSWWDGHDDYIYDVHVTITTHPDGVPPLADVGRALPSAFGQAVHLFRHRGAEWRRGDLTRFVPLISAAGHRQRS